MGFAAESHDLIKIFPDTKKEDRMTTKLDVKHVNFLNELNVWAPWTFKNNEAYASLKKEFPTLSEAEAIAIVTEWTANGPQLLVE